LGAIRVIAHQSEAIVLRTWPFHEADLLVSLFTRDQGKVKGVARSAMRSRKRFGGAMESMTHVRASYVEKPRQDLVRLDSCEVLRSPLSTTVDYPRSAGLAFLAEVLDRLLPEHDPNDAIFRLTLSVLGEMQVGAVWVPLTYFALWTTRLMGWLPELNRCVDCGAAFNGGSAYFSRTRDGLTCVAHKHPSSVPLPAESLALGDAMLRLPLKDLRNQPVAAAAPLRRFLVQALERHLDGRLVTASTLARLK
jgi:DNA repair protein RecO (recombination protein O)